MSGRGSTNTNRKNIAFLLRRREPFPDGTDSHTKPEYLGQLDTYCHIKLKSITLLILLCGPLLLAGCTAVGAGIGVVLDDNTHQEKTIPLPEIKGLTPGNDISLLLVDGSLLTGSFSGAGTMADSEYAARLDEFSRRGDKQANLPSPGDTLTLIAYNGESASRIFVGFADSSLVMLPVGDTVTANILPEHIRLTVDSRNSVVTGATYASILGGPPRLGTVILDVSGQRIEVPEQDIKQIRVPARNRFTKAGMFIGLSIDLFFIVGFLWFMSDWGH